MHLAQRLYNDVISDLRIKAIQMWRNSDNEEKMGWKNSCIVVVVVVVVVVAKFAKIVANTNTCV